MMALTPQKLLYTRQQAAEALGKSERQVDIHIARGELLAVRDGGRVKVRAEELQRFIDTLPSYIPGRSA